MKTLTLFAMLFLLSPGFALAAEPAPDAARFGVQATLERADERTPDGRYALQASARLDTGADARFQVKALAADCGTPANELFRDSYEQP